MLRQPSRSPNPQLELFPTKAPLPPRAAPLWTTLPEQKRALTGLMTRMLIAHASAVPPNGEGAGDDV